MGAETVILPTGISRLGVNAVVVTTVLSALATTLAMFRFMLRRRESFGTDDYVLMVALVFLILQVVGAYLLAFLGGEGYTTEELAQHPEKITWLLKMIYFPELSYTLVVALIKTSILYSYKRIFGHVTTTRYHIHILLALSWAWGVAIFFTCLFQCSPIDKAWLPDKPGHCIKTIPFLWGNSISNFIIDWMILLVPVRPVLKLHLPRTKKILIGLSFMCGSLACIASTIRSSKTATFNTSNIGISDYDASIWVYSEPPLATISCCLPFLSRLFGVKVLNGFRYIADHVSKRTPYGAAHITSDNDNAQATEYEMYPTPAPREESLSVCQEPSRGSQNIRTMTTTTVTSQPAMEEIHGLNSYQFSVTAPAKAMIRTESTSSLV